MSTISTGKEKFDSRIEKSNFKGTFGPLVDEIEIRKYLEKYKNIPNFKGAFYHVKYKILM